MTKLEQSAATRLHNNALFIESELIQFEDIKDPKIAGLVEECLESIHGFQVCVKKLRSACSGTHR